MTLRLSKNSPLLGKVKFHYRVSKGPPLVSILTQGTAALYLEVQFNIIITSTPTSSKYLFSSKFLHLILVCIFLFFHAIIRIHVETGTNYRGLCVMFYPASSHFLLSQVQVASSAPNFQITVDRCTA